MYKIIKKIEWMSTSIFIKFLTSGVPFSFEDSPVTRNRTRPDFQVRLDQIKEKSKNSKKRVSKLFTLVSFCRILFFEISV